METSNSTYFAALLGQLESFRLQVISHDSNEIIIQEKLNTKSNQTSNRLKIGDKRIAICSSYELILITIASGNWSNGAYFLGIRPN